LSAVTQTALSARGLNSFPYLHERVKVIDGKMPMDMLKAISN